MGDSPSPALEKSGQSQKSKNRPGSRMSVRVPLVIAASCISACALIWLGWGMYLYWNDVKLINFLAAWIPFVLSILVAFVPEHKMTTLKKWVWRSAVIVAGFIWSAVLWHQVEVTDRAAREDQARIVKEAVTRSNEHSDQQIGDVRKDVKGVKGDVKDVKGDLANTTRELGNLVNKSESDISSSIQKINKPDPPELARLEFSVFTIGSAFPILSDGTSQDKDGSYPVDFTFKNISGVPADTIDMWVSVCDQCSFAQEPPGFDKPKGMDEHTRHRIFPILNPGTSFEKITISVKSPSDTIAFDIGFKYSCKTCGKMSEEIQRIHMIKRL